MNIKNKLIEIFEDVILNGENLEEAKHKSEYKNWDSLATVTLLSVVIDEFGPIVSIDDIDKFDSFSSVLEILEKRL
ncbi:hypothetical protein [Vibrio sp. Hep-1b-8]|uniref:hypothetical protein n=1 Tax=Vibrio sp. Hep-1b-8 TaxID=2144187 RepID=UPI001110F7DF|nr:hypothetical protein [Vibrio sp. Hep-1b-8]TMX34361.1 hypothetical protein DA100_15745 [Vibrio sp. Hep-1b-8]